MAIILDADVIIRGEKGAFDFQGWVASHPNYHRGLIQLASCLNC
jgi:hypothetical protein